MHISKICCTFAVEIAFWGVISIMIWSGSRSDTRPFFLCFITHFWAKNAKKCKKMQKNAKKLQKNLHISKICCNFAPSFKKEGHETPKSNPKTNKQNEQKLFHKKLRRDLPDHSNDQSQFPY